MRHSRAEEVLQLKSLGEGADHRKITALITAPPAGRGSTAPTALTDRLRLATREQHARCEQAIDLSRRASTIDAYVQLLGAFLAFHRSVAPALDDLTRLAPRHLSARLRAREARCCADLGVLGASDRPVRYPGRIDGLAGLARQLGAWYVLEGSALGGTVIAHHVRHSVPAAAGALSFLAGDASSAAANWRGFRRFADGCDARMHLDFGEVVAGAEGAFEQFVAIAQSS